jgi:capsular exopolysaccharide synthesis family protein
MSEAFRAVRTNVLFSLIDRRLHTLVVTSTAPGEGKTISACNLAITMAEAGTKVVLVDADFRRPDLHHVFGVGHKMGLGNVILGQMRLTDALHPTKVPNLRVLTVGTIPPNPSELLGSAAMAEIINSLKQTADVIVFDTPPVGPVTDATVLAPVSDAVVMVVEPSRSGAPSILLGLQTLRAVKANVLGVILNKVRGQQAPGYYYYGPPSRNGSRGELLQPELAPRSVAVNGGERPAARPMGAPAQPGPAATPPAPSPPTPPIPTTPPSRPQAPRPLVSPAEPAAFPVLPPFPPQHPSVDDPR